jgi:hypothetical protein
MAGSKGARALPDGAADNLSPAEQAHIDSGGTTPLPEAPAPSDTAPPAEAPAAEPPPLEADAKPKMVPHAALHEERELRKAAEKRASTLEERTNLLFDAMRSGRAGTVAPPPPQAVAPEPVPSFETDPTGHLLGTMRQQNEALRTLAALVVNQHQQSQSSAALGETARRIAALENEFERDNADYTEARRYVIEARDRQLLAIGHHDPAERQHIIAQESRAVAANALRTGLNPAAAAYALARSMGYQQAAPSARSPASSQPSAAERIASAAHGQRQGGGLSGVRGSGPTPLTAQRLLEMSDSDFARTIATPEGRALLGV